MSGWGPKLAAQRIPFWNALRFVAASAILTLCSSHATHAQTPADTVNSAQNPAPPTTAANTAPPKPAASPLHFQISTPRTTYRAGEVIRIQMDFTTDVDHAFRILSESTDAADPGVDNVTITPADLAPPYDAKMASLIRPSADAENNVAWVPLDKSGTHLSLVLNDSYVLKKPGELRVRIESHRITADFGGETENNNAPAFPLTSNELSITIVPATPEWQASELKQIEAQIDAHPPTADGTPSPERQQAIDRLIYLNSPDAVRELVRRFATANGDEMAQYAVGMSLSDYRSLAMESVNKLIDDPAFGVSYEFEGLMLLLPSIGTVEPNLLDNAFEAARTTAEPQLWAALATKRGQAFATTFETALRMKSEIPGADATASVQQAIPKLVAMFPELSKDDQARWLTSHWNDIKDPSWAPVLRAIATESATQPQTPRSEVYDPSAAANSAALADWAEVDPQGARQTILTAMMSGQTEFGSDALGSLPDKTLPEAQQRQLAQLFVTADGAAPQLHFAEMLNRYGDASAWDGVSNAVSQSLRNYPCDTQIEMLSFATRISTDAATALFETAMAPPDNGAKECRSLLLSATTLGEKSEVPEKYAIAELDDSNPAVVTSAAQYLGAHGSAKAEAPLWRRYEAWAATVANPQGPNQTLDNAKLQEIRIGVQLADALERGPGWLADREKLDRLNALAGTSLGAPVVGEDVLRPWMRSPIVVSCNAVSDNESQFVVAQYVTSSLDTLKSRLALFPSGTTLAWDGHACTSESKYGVMLNDLESSASLKGITLKPVDAVPAVPSTPTDTNDGNDEAPVSLNGFSPDADNIVADRVVVVN